MLVERVVITHEDVERILGPRPWKSRGDEIIAANESKPEESAPEENAPDEAENNAEA